MFYVLGLTVAVAVSTPAVVAEIRRLWALRNSDELPIAEATVQRADVGEVRTDYSHYFRADVGYFYVVNGSYYSGYVERRFNNEAAAQEYCRKTAGTKFRVRYHPVRNELSKAVEEVSLAKN
jgi:hypothetical protein